ncbi:MAG: zinc ribbon domain-containing protein [Rhodocyclaceae bacterium]|jgi:putative FmdB family regulatory protein|nr:zinc ribbon domain-containing protein [Rhodocyclaceae bacterium]MBK6907725.1 zinc ribbon domain-containing protein [Rhodocyclaceae bacterium]
MPLYDYAPSSGHCDQCPGRFEVMQRIADDKLTHCPRCQQACERQVSRVALGGKYSTSEAAVKSSGFTRYQKAENGVYERTAGTGGPEILYRD